MTLGVQFNSDFAFDISKAIFDDTYANKPFIFSIPGSYTITYNNVYNTSFNFEITAEDYLKFNGVITAPYYDINGSINRVIS